MQRRLVALRKHPASAAAVEFPPTGRRGMDTSGHFMATSSGQRVSPMGRMLLVTACWSRCSASIRSTPATGSDPTHVLFDRSLKHRQALAPGAPRVDRTFAATGGEVRPMVQSATRCGLKCVAAPTISMRASTLTPHTPPAEPGPQLPRLYTFRRCPYAMRARLALLQAGRIFEAVEVSLRDKASKLAGLVAQGYGARAAVARWQRDRVELGDPALGIGRTRCAGLVGAGTVAWQSRFGKAQRWRLQASPGPLEVPPAVRERFPHARRTPRPGAGRVAATAGGPAAQRALPGRRHALRHRPSSDALRPPVRFVRPGVVCNAEPAIGAGLAGRLACQPAVRCVHVQVARARCDSLSVALALAWLSIRSRSELVIALAAAP